MAVYAITCRHCGTRRNWTKNGTGGFVASNFGAGYPCSKSSTGLCQPSPLLTRGERMVAELANVARKRRRA